ncbi:MAG: glycosyltransferase family 2 protein [Methylotenera sp.]|nr:glycosyltransferase family 2 protein [Methylotenera sp.]
MTFIDENLKPDVSVIVVNYNTEQLLPKMLSDLKLAATNITLQIIVVDNASRDDSEVYMREHMTDCELIFNQANVGFGRANNQALSLIRGRYVLLLNTDAFVSSDTLTKTISHMDANPECGILGVRLLGRDGDLQPSCRYFPTPWSLFVQRAGLQKFFKSTRLMDDMQWDHASVRACDWVPGCYYLIRREVVEQVGLFDPRYFLYYEEVDHCFAAKKAGWQVHYYPDTTVVHIGGESAKSDGEITSSGHQLMALQVESELLYIRKNHGAFAVFMNVILTTLASAIVLAKSLLKARRPIPFLFCGQQVLLVWKSYFETHFGNKATR